MEPTAVAESTLAGGLSLIGAVSPFGSGTEISFRQPAGGAAKLEIFDIAGRRVRTIVLAPEGPGPRQARWDGRDASGAEAPSGVYVYRLEAGREVLTGRVVKVR